MSGMTPASNGVEDVQDMDASTSSVGGSSINTAATSTESTAAAPSGDTAVRHPDSAHKEPYTTEEIDAQVAHVAKLSEKALDEGERGVVISIKWLERVMSRSTEGKNNRSYAKDAREGLVGELDNSDIIPENAYQCPLPDMQNGRFIPLKPGLEHGTEFRIFPYDAYGFIIGLYGTTHTTPIVRYAHNTADSGVSQNNIMYETYPPVLTIRKVPQSGQQLAEPKAKQISCSDNLAKLKARRDAQEKFGQRSPEDAVRLVTSKSEKIQKFMTRAKEAAGIPRKTKVKVFRQLNPANVAVDLPDNKPSGVPSPPPSRPASPNEGVSTPATKLVLDPVVFSKMSTGVDLEPVDIIDNTANANYNGSMVMGPVVFEDQTLVFEEQMGGAGGGEFVSDSQANLKTGSVPPHFKGTASAATSGRTSPAITGVMTRGRTSKNGRTRGTVGLSNLGNTCYMNSALQCIRSVEELAVFFMTKKYKREINNDNPLGHNGRMANAYYTVIDGIYGSTSSSSFSPKAFKNSLGNAQPMFSGWGQQDSQEFLSFLVDALHEDLNRIKKKPYSENPDSDDATVHDPQAIIELGETYRNNHKSRNDSVAMDLFNGFYKNKMECPICDKVSVTFDPFSLLTVQLPINTKREHTVTFFPLRGRPVRHRLELDPNASFKSLMEKIASKHSGVDSNRMVMTEVFSHKTYRLFGAHPTLANDNIVKNDHIFFYEVDGVPTNPVLQEKPYGAWNENAPLKNLPADPMNSPVSDCFFVPIFHRMKDNSFNAVLHPLYITVTRDEAKDYALILKKVLIAVSKLTSRAILHEFRHDNSEEKLNKADGSKDQDSIGAEDVAGVSDHSTEDGYVNVEMEKSDDITDSQVLANGTSAMQIDEHDHDIPDNFMDPSYELSPALGEHLFEVLVGNNSREKKLHVNDIPSDRDMQAMLSRVKVPSRRSSIQSNNSGDDGSDAESAEQGDVEDEESDGNRDEPDIVMGGERSEPVVNGSDSEDILTKSGTISPFPNQARRNKTRKHGKNKKKNRKQNHRQGNLKKKEQYSYGNGNRSFSSSPQQEDSPYYVQLGEGIVLNWQPEAFDALFEGDPQITNDMRGHRLTNDDGTGPDVFPDPELDAKRSKMQARQKNGISLDECFDETGKREVLSEDNAWYCNRCKEMRLAAKTLEIWTLPDILVVHLKRFGGARGSRDKIDVHVDYPIRELDMSDRVGLKEDGKSYVYDLFAVDNHYGGLGGGHYTAMAKNFNDDQWYDYNGEYQSYSGKYSSLLTSRRRFLQ
jgi:ubiquitin carboxyl-terminal hydrolase 4/11/15